MHHQVLHPEPPAIHPRALQVRRDNQPHAGRRGRRGQRGRPPAGKGDGHSHHPRGVGGRVQTGVCSEQALKELLGFCVMRGFFSRRRGKEGLKSVLRLRRVKILMQRKSRRRPRTFKTRLLFFYVFWQNHLKAGTNMIQTATSKFDRGSTYHAGLMRSKEGQHSSQLRDSVFVPTFALHETETPGTQAFCSGRSSWLGLATVPNTIQSTALQTSSSRRVSQRPNGSRAVE